jgi:hypothetical protein
MKVAIALAGSSLKKLLESAGGICYLRAAERFRRTPEGAKPLVVGISATPSNRYLA